MFLNGRASVSLECMNSIDGECRSVLYGVAKIFKSVEKLSDCMDWREGVYISNVRIIRGVASYL